MYGKRYYEMPPYDRVALMSDGSGDGPANPPYPDNPNDPCYGCGNWYGPCVWPCYRQTGYDKFPKRA